MGIVVPLDQNIAPKYKDLEIEIFKMWAKNMKTIPVIIGAFGY